MSLLLPPTPEPLERSLSSMDRYELVLVTDNPDVLDRIIEAFSRVGWDRDNQDGLNYLEASLFAIDEDGYASDMRWGTIYDPDPEEGT